ncbi:MAG: glycosyltransferase involved in cell wall biosynthesis [Gammaproteobacteria bacterium]|jgi:glycosyltransferase involved in cell wall biosynthesis
MPLVVTPIIITLDEAPNIERVLARLHWAGTVLVVDSGSTDGTQAIAQRFANVQLVEHTFIDAASQWNFAIGQARAFSSWLLALDSDYVLSDEFIDSVRLLPHAPKVDAYRASFVYCVHGRALRGSLYPAKPVLFNADCARYTQRGHTQVLQVDGKIGEVGGLIFHDDRKPRSRWLRSQWRYAREEAELIDRNSWAKLGWSARMRKLLFAAAPAAFLLALFWRGAVFDGWHGLLYALERLVAELLITIALLERKLAGVEQHK